MQYILSKDEYDELLFKADEYDAIYRIVNTNPEVSKEDKYDMIAYEL